jgi:uncharacterized membrane protein
MSVINKTVLIKAPVSRVFAFVTAPQNWTRYVTSLVDVRDLSADAPAKGSTFRWAYKMMGVTFTGTGTITENVKNRRFGMSLRSKMNINESYEFSKSENGATELKVRIEYEMPGQVLAYLADTRLVERLNNLEARNVLDKIRMMCEQ